MHFLRLCLCAVAICFAPACIQAKSAAACGLDAQPLLHTIIAPNLCRRPPLQPDTIYLFGPGYRIGPLLHVVPDLSNILDTSHFQLSKLAYRRLFLLEEEADSLAYGQPLFASFWLGAGDYLAWRYLYAGNEEQPGRIQIVLFKNNRFADSLSLVAKGRPRLDSVLLPAEILPSSTRLLQLTASADADEYTQFNYILALKAGRLWLANTLTASNTPQKKVASGHPWVLVSGARRPLLLEQKTVSGFEKEGAGNSRYFQFEVYRKIRWNGRRMVYS